MRNIRLLISYIKDKETSLIKKLLILGSLLYFVLPFDLVPDFILGIGWLDDVLVVIFIWMAVKSELDSYNRTKQKKCKRTSKILEFKQKNSSRGN